MTYGSLRNSSSLVPTRHCNIKLLAPVNVTNAGSTNVEEPRRMSTSPAQVCLGWGRMPGHRHACVSSMTSSLRIVANLIILLTISKALCVSARADTVPAGGYTQSCIDIKVVGKSLTATCKDRNQRLAAPSTLQNFASCINDIANIDGHLTCAVPLGGYLQSCVDAKVVWNNLTATCKDFNLRFAVPSTLPMTCSERRVISAIGVA
jgi:hypothetical protein